jgi:hypothetical protein
MNRLKLVKLVYCLRWSKYLFNRKSERSNELLGLIHTNICGSMTICVIGGYTYFITFFYDYYKYGYVYLMKLKFKLFEKFKEFRNDIEKQAKMTIKIFQSQQGREYLI